MSIFDFSKKKQTSIGIVPDKETQKMLNTKEEETFTLFIKYLLDSGRFETNVESLVHKYKSAPFNVITDGKLLSLDQKKELGLNSRKKYGENYIKILTQKGFSDNASVDFFANSYYQTFGIASRKFEIEKIKKSGITKCRISSCNDMRDCEAIKKYGNKVFDVNHVPELPLPECTAEYCRCMIVAVLD